MQNLQGYSPKVMVSQSIYSHRNHDSDGYPPILLWNISKDPYYEHFIYIYIVNINIPIIYEPSISLPIVQEDRTAPI